MRMMKISHSSHQGRHGRGECFDILQNVEMWELGIEMDKDGRVVFRLGRSTR